MPTLERLEGRIGATRQLQSVVKTMKALAAVNIRHYEQAAESLREYYAVIAAGLQVVLGSGVSPVAGAEEGRGAGLGLIVAGSDQGMCGRFNEVVGWRVGAALEERNVPPKSCAVAALGGRVVGPLQEAGLTVQHLHWTPNSPAEITTRVQELLLQMDAWLARHAVGRVLLCYNAQAGTTYEPRIQTLIPLDPDWLRELAGKDWPARSLPSFAEAADRLLPSLVRRFLFAALHRAVAESMAAENAARLQTMQAAEDNIAGQLEDLTARRNRQRQSSIDAELLDIVAGFEALVPAGSAVA